MAFSTLLLSSLAAVAYAAPQGSPSPLASCINLRVQDAWLIGECLTGQDATTRIESTVYLNGLIKSQNDRLTWNPNGGFAPRCGDCKLTTGLVMSCKCSDQSYPALGPVSTLDLAEYIAPYSGFLRSTLKGAPKPPSTPSTTRFPSDPSYSVRQGSPYCYAPGQTFCSSFPAPIESSPGLCPDYKSKISGYGEPLACEVAYVPTNPPYWYEFEHMGVEAPGKAWEFVYFDNLECKGEPIRSVKGDDLGKCLSFGERKVLGYSARPLWNADY